jgi:iron-sulfur cluster repair protein YtfE (RIC family)
MRTISEHMKIEHAHLQKLWDDFCNEEDLNYSPPLFVRFKESLLSHMKLEEGNLSPTFNKCLGIDEHAGQAMAINRDHSNILKILNKVESDMKSGDMNTLSMSKKNFTHALVKHHTKEEDMLYNLFDTIITKKDWADILQGRI